jgi:hypothetical protein
MPHESGFPLVETQSSGRFGTWHGTTSVLVTSECGRGPVTFPVLPVTKDLVPALDDVLLLGVRTTVLWSDLELEHPYRVPFHLVAGVEVAPDHGLAGGADGENPVELVRLIVNGVPVTHGS